MPEQLAFNMDCLEALKDVPDKYFDLCIADPPYGLNITGQHGSQTVNVERESERKSSEAQDHSAVKIARVYGSNKKALSSQRFILCSTIAPRRTRKLLRRF